MERVRRLRTRDVDTDSPTTGRPRVAAAPDTSGSVSGDFEAAVQVIYGAGVQTLPLVGLRVADARPLVETLLRVERRSPALVNGRPVPPDYVIARGDRLEFVHHAGEKGRITWTSESKSRTIW